MKITGLKTWVVGNPPPGFGGRYFVFLKLVTDNGIEGVGEAYAATFHPNVVVRDDRGRGRAPCHRHRPVPDRGAVAQGLWPRLQPAARHLAHGRDECRRDGLVGHRRQGGREAGLRAPGRARARAPAHLHLHLPARRRDRRDLRRPRPVGAAGGRVCHAGLHRGEVRPRRADSPPSTRASPRSSGWSCRRPSAASCARRWAARPICCSAPTASSPPRAPSAWASAWRSTSRSGSRSRCRPRCPRRWRPWRARCDPGRHRRAADHQVRVRPRAADAAPPRSCR